MRKVLTACGLLVALVLFQPFNAKADTIFTDLASSSPLHLGGGFSIGSTSNITVGYAFTPGSTYDLSQIDVAIGWETLSSDSVTLGLYADSSNAPDFTNLLESWTFTPPFYTSSTDGLDTLTPTSTIELTSGSQYWLVATNNSATSETEVWDENNQSVTGPHYFESTSQTAIVNTAQMGAFDVLGTLPKQTTNSVPEPSSLSLLLVGLAALGLLTFLGRRKQLRQADSDGCLGGFLCP